MRTRLLDLWDALRSSLWSLPGVMSILAGVAAVLLRNFMGDRRNQVMPGAFVATYVYCLIVLQAVRGSGPTGFVPAVSGSGSLGQRLLAVYLRGAVAPGDRRFALVFPECLVAAQISGSATARLQNHQ
jgi:uncharacterized membrane protein